MGFARALLILGAQEQTRIICAREVQKSIKQSVHQLLSDQIVALGMTAFYEVLETEIRGVNGTVFSFAGLASHTVESIKSFEGCDLCWVEEAQTVSKRAGTFCCRPSGARGLRCGFRSTRSWTRTRRTSGSWSTSPTTAKPWR